MSTLATEEEAPAGWLRPLVAGLSEYDAARVDDAASSLLVAAYPAPAAGASVAAHAVTRSPPMVPFARAFPSVAALAERALSRDPAAIEAAVDLYGTVDADAAAPLLIAGPLGTGWPRLRMVLRRALSRSTREDAFAALLDGLRDGRQAPPAPNLILVASAFPDGVARARSRLLASPVLTYAPVHALDRARSEQLSEAERQADQRRLAELSKAVDWGAVQEACGLLGYLGVRRDVAIRGLAAQLAREHPSRHVRLAATGALEALGDRESLEEVVAIGDASADPDDTFFVVGLRARVALSPEDATRLLEPGAVPGRRPETYAGHLFLAIAYEAQHPRAGSDAPAGSDASWLSRDARWIDVAAVWSMRKTEAAGALLNLFPANERAAALARARGEEVKAGARAGFRRTRRAVDPARLAEARDTMRRACESLERIVERLPKLGYRFERPQAVHVRAAADVAARLEGVEAVLGPLPATLRAAFEHLGAWNLMGDHPDWPRSANVRLRAARTERQAWLTDPFVFAPITALIDELPEEGQPLAWAFSGDALTKAGFSGGSYALELPGKDDDPRIVGGAKNRRFVEQLTRSLTYGGFAGFAAIADRPAVLIDQLITGLPALKTQ